MLLVAILISLPVVLILRGVVKRKRDRLECQKKVQEARDKILADGIIEGPKGPYVPHKKWDVGTPHETAPAKQSVYHGDSWH